MKLLKLFTVAATLAVAGTTANALTMNVLGGTSVAFGFGNYDSICDGGDSTKCYNPSGFAGTLTKDLLAFDNAGSYPGLQFSPAGQARITVTFLGTEAGAFNDAISFGIGGDVMLNNKSNSLGDSTSVIVENLAGTVPFGFESSLSSMAGSNGFSGMGAIAFSDVFNGGRSVYAYFDDSGANMDRDWDDMVVQIDIAPIPLPAAAWMLLAGLGGLYGLRRTRKTA